MRQLLRAFSNDKFAEDRFIAAGSHVQPVRTCASSSVWYAAACVAAAARPTCRHSDDVATCRSLGLLLKLHRSQIAKTDEIVHSLNADIIITIFKAHQHKAAGRKTRLDIQNYGCNGNLLCYHGVVERNRISLYRAMERRYYYYKCKKLNSLKHLVRTTVAGSHN